MTEQLVERIKSCPTLPSLPAIAIEVLELAQKDECDISEIAEIISRDPALSTKILRTVNSSFYARSQTVSTISHALVILGLQSVKTLVLGFSLVANLSKGKSKGFKHVAYWKRSIYAATAARTLAAKVAQVQSEECFLAALLMDIGMLVLDQVLGEEYAAVVEKQTSHEALLAVEAAALGMHHAEVASILAEQWRLPPILAVPMRFHHRPEMCRDQALRDFTQVICLAGRIADIYVDENAAAAIKDARQLCFNNYSMSESDCDAMLEEIGKRTREVASLFEISVPVTTYEAIHKKAHEALIELTLTSHQEAAKLEVQNLQLKVQATTDGLTGLANRAQFDRFLAEKFAAAAISVTPLTMLLLDVDKFKAINDRYGHQAGDTVLQHLGKLLLALARPTDLACRYGGEELVLVLPETDRQKGSQSAETLRRAVAARPVKCGNITVPVTASIGVAIFEPPTSPFREPAHLVKAADLAVYAAKHNGRNCVKVFSLKPPVKADAA